MSFAQSDSLPQLASTCLVVLARRIRARTTVFALYAGGRWRTLDVLGDRTQELWAAIHPKAEEAIGRTIGPVFLELAERRMVAVGVPVSGMHVLVAATGPDLDWDWLRANWPGLAGCLGAAVERLTAESDPEKAMAVLAHEMRTPLTSIKGYALSMLRNDVQWTGADLRGFATLIDEETETLIQMVSEVLEASTHRSGSLEVQLEPTLIGKIATATLREFAARDSCHQYFCSIPDRLPAVMGDPVRLRQVLNNLLDNASKYAVKGAIVLSAQEAASDVVVSVADEGPGLRPEHLNRLFERYFRVKNNGSRVAGTGLGLPLARDLVERQGGRIWATSSEGRGTTVSFSIPKVLR